MPDNKSAVRFLQSALLSLVLIATLTATANSQITRFTLTLRVTDQLGQPVAGAPVAITIEGTTQTITAVSSDDGVVVVDLDAGTYKITVSANGFAKFEESIALTSNLTKDVILMIGGVQKITAPAVTAAGPQALSLQISETEQESLS